MATKGQNYGVGIGTGAAGGAAAGSVFGPWGTAIGAGVGAIGGAISAGVANAKEADEKRHLEQAQERSRKAILYDLYRKMAQSGGFDTTYPDTLMQLKGQQLAEQAQNAQFAAAHRIDPNSFATMAQLGTQAAGRTYNSLNQPAQPLDFAPLPYGKGSDLTSKYAADSGGVGNYVGDVPGGTTLPSIESNAPVNPLYQDQRQDWLRSLA